LLARALMTGLIALAYRGRLASSGTIVMGSIPPIASHAGFPQTIWTAAMIWYAYGVEINTSLPFVRTHTLHVQRTNASSPSHTPTID
jgi:hypothetical protein